MNQIINMIMRRVMGRLINKGVDIGFDQALKLGKGRRASVDRDGNPVQPSAEEMARRDRSSREQGKQARNMVKNMRKLTRF